MEKYANQRYFRHICLLEHCMAASVFPVLVMELCSKADNFLNKTLKISQFCLTEDSQMTTHAEEKNAFTAPELFVSTPEVLDLCCKKQSDVWRYGKHCFVCYFINYTYMLIMTSHLQEVGLPGCSLKNTGHWHKILRYCK